jgi:DNA-directed RNA polymerase specialized sigma24 family protein
MLGHEQDANDVAQDVALVAFEKIKADIRNPRGWFLGITDKMCLRRLAKRARGKEVTETDYCGPSESGDILHPVAREEKESPEQQDAVDLDELLRRLSCGSKADRQVAAVIRSVIKILSEHDKERRKLGEAFYQRPARAP